MSINTIQLIILLLLLCVIGFIIYNIHRSKNNISTISSKVNQPGNFYYLPWNSVVEPSSSLFSVDLMPTGSMVSSQKGPPMMLLNSSGDLQFLSSNVNLLGCPASGGKLIWNTDTSGNNTLVIGDASGTISLVSNYGGTSPQILRQSLQMNGEPQFVFVRYGGLAVYDDNYELIYPNCITADMTIDESKPLYSFFGRYKAIVQNASLQIVDTQRNDLLIWNYGPVSFHDNHYLSLSTKGLCMYSGVGTTVSSCLCQNLPPQCDLAILDETGSLKLFSGDSRLIWNSPTTGKGPVMYAPSVQDVSANFLNPFEYLLSPLQKYQLIVSQYFKQESSGLSPTNVALEVRDTSTNLILWTTAPSCTEICLAYCNYYKLTFTSNGDLALMDVSYNDCIQEPNLDISSCCWNLSSTSTYKPDGTAYSLKLTDDPALLILNQSGTTIYTINISSNTSWTADKDVYPGASLTNNGYTLTFTGEQLILSGPSGTIWTGGLTPGTYKYPKQSALHMWQPNIGLPCGSAGDFIITNMLDLKLRSWAFSQCPHYTNFANAEMIKLNSDGTFGVYASNGTPIWLNTYDPSCSSLPC